MIQLINESCDSLPHETVSVIQEAGSAQNDHQENDDDDDDDDYPIAMEDLLNEATDSNYMN